MAVGLRGYSASVSAPHRPAMSDTALVVRWLIWAVLLSAVLSGTDALGLPFWQSLLLAGVAGVPIGLLLRWFERLAIRHNLWPD